MCCREGLAAAKLLFEGGYYGFAASRAYYTMFYIAKTLLLGKELLYSKQSGVHAGHSEHFV
ncbi:MAG: HEPN domain-containing protein [Candidatus Latescibacterota bacterium]